MPVGSFETLASGYGLAEAPCWESDRGSLLFSDVFGGGVHRWSAGEAVATVVPKRRGIGGMALHADGGVVVSGRDVVHVRNGETRTLLAHEGVTGFNDLATDVSGRVYVGTLRYNLFAGEAPAPGELWRIDAAGEATELFGDLEWANGIGFSPDGATIYACDYARGTVIAHDLDDGRAVDRRELVKSPSGSVDGLAVDQEGCLWVALAEGGGVGRFRPDGALEDVLDVPASFVSSLCFGGPDMCDLYITTSGSTEEPAAGAVLRTSVNVPGLPVMPAIV
jgi:sugar lactone lactonase YvrE